MLLNTTWFRLAHVHDLPSSYLKAREIESRARKAQIDGLLASQFLMRTPKEWTSMSFWSGPEDIPRFGTAVDEHTDAARWILPRLALRNDSPAVWSAQWRLTRARGNVPDWCRAYTDTDQPGW